MQQFYWFCSRFLRDRRNDDKVTVTQQRQKKNWRMHDWNLYSSTKLWNIKKKLQIIRNSFFKHRDEIDKKFHLKFWDIFYIIDFSIILWIQMDGKTWLTHTQLIRLTLWPRRQFFSLLPMEEIKAVNC